MVPVHFTQRCQFILLLPACQFMHSYSQSKSSVHDKLHELHSYFPPIAQRTPSIITSSCWKSTVSDVTASGIDWKKGPVQNFTCSLALTIRNLYDYKTKEYVDVLTSQSLLFKEWVSFFLGSWGMNRCVVQTNRMNREAVLVRFVCSALRFIPHESR